MICRDIDTLQLTYLLPQIPGHKYQIPLLNSPTTSSTFQPQGGTFVVMRIYCDLLLLLSSESNEFFRTLVPPSSMAVSPRRVFKPSFLHIPSPSTNPLSLQV